MTSAASSGSRQYAFALQPVGEIRSPISNKKCIRAGRTLQTGLQQAPRLTFFSLIALIP
jgi:hypothetical protein